MGPPSKWRLTHSTGANQRTTDLTRLYSSSPPLQIALLDPTFVSTVAAMGNAVHRPLPDPGPFRPMGASMSIGAMPWPRVEGGRSGPGTGGGAGHGPTPQVVAAPSSVALPGRWVVLAVLLAAPFLAVLDAFIVMI